MKWKQMQGLLIIQLARISVLGQFLEWKYVKNSVNLCIKGVEFKK